MDKQFVILPGGERIAYRVYGNGRKPILFLHGLVGGARFGAPWVFAIETADVRVYAPERPGYGDSSPIALSVVAGFMPIARRLFEAWGIAGVDVVGCSAGAPYAYAAALGL